MQKTIQVLGMQRKRESDEAESTKKIILWGKEKRWSGKLQVAFASHRRSLCIHTAPLTCNVALSENTMMMCACRMRCVGKMDPFFRRRKRTVTILVTHMHHVPFLCLSRRISPFIPYPQKHYYYWMENMLTLISMDWNIIITALKRLRKKKKLSSL